MNNEKETSVHIATVSRRDFLKNSSLLAAGAAVVSFPSIVRAQTTAPINAVVVGLGGRGGGAGNDFREAAKIVGVEGKIVATADLFPEQAMRGVKEYGVDESKCFSGFDAYQKAIAVPGVNYVIIATPPGFKPPVFKAAIEAGKHVFMEKPVATDGPGCRIMYETGKMADQKGLKVAAGTQRRHQAGYIDTIKRIQDGAIGDIVTLRVYWVNGGPIWHRGDQGQSALERQIRNWYHYIWLSGDHICEQEVHNLDVANWVMGDTHPVKCWGMGARQQLGNATGEIWDEFAVEYEYPNGVHMFSYCGQIKRSGSPGVSESVAGTKGTANPGGNISVKGGERWRSSLKLESGNPYVQEHVDLLKAIQKGTELNETKNVTDSTLTAIMGREAAYSGDWVEWDAILNSKFQYGPAQLYDDASKMQFGDFRTLKPPMPSKHNILKDPSIVAGA
jgi:myo-inositol 2-dehydrogenase / D-chiro-inositol 1-dehydrogenase